MESSSETPSILIDNANSLKEQERLLSEIRPQLDVVKYLSQVQERLKNQKGYLDHTNPRAFEQSFRDADDNSLKYLFSTLENLLNRSIAGHGTENTALERLSSAGVILSIDMNYVSGYTSDFSRLNPNAQEQLLSIDPQIVISIENLYVYPKARDNDPIGPGIYTGTVTFSTNHAKTQYELAKSNVRFDQTLHKINNLRSFFQSLDYKERQIFEMQRLGNKT